MIVGSLLLILVAVGLLVAGVLSSSNVLIIGSIVATVVAAIVLILGVRQSANGADEEEEYDELESDEADTSSHYRGSSARRDRDTPSRASRSSTDGDSDRVAADASASEGGITMTEEVAPGAIPSQAGDRYESTDDDFEPAPSTDESGAPQAQAQFAPTESGSGMDDDPPDEPSAQATSPSNAARIATMTAEVLVIDGRPRYHVGGCVHLLGRESEPLPVGEALELGFSPCGMCEPDSELLAEAGRV